MIKLTSLPFPLEMAVRSFACLLPPSLRMGKTYWQWRKLLLESETWSKEEIRQYQLLQLRTILKHAYENTIGYRRIFEATGVIPEKLIEIEDIQKFPFTYRETFRDHPEEFSVNMSRHKVRTSGSTGIPLILYYDKQSRIKERALADYHRSWIGYDIDAKHFVLSFPIRYRVENAPQHWKYFPYPNRLVCSVNHLKPEWMSIFHQKAWEYKPDFVECYPSAGVTFAEFLRETGREFPPVKAVFPQSENLYNWQKNLLKEVFNAPVFAYYGDTELAAFAGYCQYEEVYHVFPQYGFTELVDENGKEITEPGQIGEIVGTSFIMKATPFIRYRTRDFAKLKGYGCPACGRPYHVWERIEGRLQDMIVTKTGRYVNMHDTDNIDYDGVELFQFYQDTPGKVVFRYLPKQANLIEVQRNKIIAGLRHRLGDDVDLEIQRVQNISRTERGKYRYLEQKLKLSYGDN